MKMEVESLRNVGDLFHTHIIWEDFVAFSRRENQKSQLGQCADPGGLVIN
jgi:hypothetical protein